MAITMKLGDLSSWYDKSVAQNEPVSYAEWLQWAEQTDSSNGNLSWREQERSQLYDYRAIGQRLQRLKDLQAKGDERGLLFALHEGVHGNMGGMGNADLYRRAYSGTKHLVEDYIEEIVSCLHLIDEAPETVISKEEKLAFFLRVESCFGRSALMLSGGALMGYFHYGVAKALFEQDVLPTVISGSSAGAITAGVLGTHSDKELRKVFSPEQLTLDAKYEVSHLDRLLNPRGERLQEQNLRETIEHLIPDMTFEEAYAKTGRQINISVAPATRHQTSRLLNSITSPNVFIRSAVMASCAVPGVFPAVKLKARNFKGVVQDYLPGRRWVDGTVAEDLPAKRLSRLYGVNHYIASQVNPHVVPFLLNPEGDSMMSVVSKPYRLFALEWVRSQRRLQQKLRIPLPKRSLVLFDTLYQVFDQKYTADISIVLDPRHIAPLRLMSKPTVREVEQLMSAGEKATWPKIPRIRNCTRISEATEAILTKYRPI